MRIATSSVRSIRKRLPAVLNWLADRKPDIVALQKISVSEAAFPTRVLAENGYQSAGIRSGRSDGLRCCRPKPAGAAEARDPLPGPALPRSE